MDFIQGFGLPILVTLVATLVVYFFRMKQLYLLIPRMFHESEVFDGGKLVELRVFNKGNGMEEDIEIVVPSDITCTLLASELPGIVLQQNLIKIRRLPAKSEISILILIEGKVDANNFFPSITSKSTKGKLFKKQEDIPLNAGNVILSILAILGFLVLLFYAPDKYFEYRENTDKAEITEKYGYLEKEGWVGIESYALSKLKVAYQDFEFPLTFKSVEVKNNTISIVFSVANKTAVDMKISSYFERVNSDSSDNVYGLGGVFDLDVPALSSEKFTVKLENDEKIDLKQFIVNIYISYGDEFLHGVHFVPYKNSEVKRAVNQKEK